MLIQRDIPILFDLQNGDECHCGDDIEADSVSRDQCHVACDGGPQGDRCGSDVTLSVWRAQHGMYIK